MIDKSMLKRMVRKTGVKTRVLYTYSSDQLDIKKRHEQYAVLLDDHFIPSDFSHAYTKNRSIYTNALMHRLNDVFIKVDVKDFFPSLNHQFLADEMFFELNKLHPNTITLSECRSVVDDSSVNTVGLSLGLIPSPALSNIYMKRFDGLLYGRLKKLELPGIMYTRYADDIFISFKNDLPPTVALDDIRSQIVGICSQELRRCHLRINTKKTRFVDLNVSNHVKMAGINIVKTDDARKLTISRKVIKQLYFRALAVHSSIDSNKLNESLNAEIAFIKGMQSFILSIEKTGYSQILSPNMQARVRALGYDNLEDMITQMKPIVADDHH